MVAQSEQGCNSEKPVEKGTSGVVFDINQITAILPHRYPFLLIDKIVEFEDNVRIVGIKNVTANEPFFVGHFPNRPVMPGVLVIEAMAQVGAILAHRSSDGVLKGKNVFLAACSDFKWKRPVVPGDTLRIEMVSKRKRRPIWTMDGTVYVDDKVVALGTITAAEVD